MQALFELQTAIVCGPACQHQLYPTGHVTEARNSLHLTSAGPGDGDSAVPADVEHFVQVNVEVGTEIVADAGDVGEAHQGGAAVGRRRHRPATLLDVLVAGGPQGDNVVVAGRASLSFCRGSCRKEQEECRSHAAANRDQLRHLGGWWIDKLS